PNFTMLITTLELVRCPLCGGRLELVTSLFHRTQTAAAGGDEVIDGILGCQCCIFPVVAGVPILHIQPQANTARDQVQAGRPDLAFRTMTGLDDDSQAARLEARAASDTATYPYHVAAFGPTFEG